MNITQPRLTTGDVHCVYKPAGSATEGDLYGY